MDARAAPPQNLRVQIDLTDLDLEIAARACRALAHRQEQDAARIDNPTVKGPLERIAKHAAVLAERFEAAKKQRRG